MFMKNRLDVSSFSTYVFTKGFKITSPHFIFFTAFAKIQILLRVK